MCYILKKKTTKKHNVCDSDIRDEFLSAVFLQAPVIELLWSDDDTDATQKAEAIILINFISM